MEKFDLFDKNRQPTGKTVERGQIIPDGMYRMVVHLAVFSSDGKILIQRRTDDKSSWAGLWDITLGGHVISGETSYQGVCRELSEELGLKMNKESLRPSFTINFSNGFDDYYITEMNVDIMNLTLQPDEVSAVAWAEKEEIMSMIDSGDFIPYKKSLINMLFEMRNSMGAHK